jgi:glycosyltransferase involved in cell wall biosynthesis
MKVLHVTPLYEPAWSAGGVVRGTSLLCRALSRLGLDVTVYTTDSSGRGRLDVPINQSVNVGGVRVFYFHADTLGGFCYSRALSRACRETLRRFDLMHLASIWNYPGIVASSQARKQKLPYVVSTDGALQEGALKQKRLKKWLFLKFFVMSQLRGADAIRYVSELERARTSHLRLDVPTFMIPTGLDFREFERLSTRQTARVELGIPEYALVIGHLGRLDRRKALDVLIKGYAKISYRFPSAMLLLAGSDYGEVGRLRALVRELNLDQRIRFLGYIDKRSTLLVATDLMTLIGLDGEAFGNAAVEAAASGVPVLMSGNVGVARTLEADGAGMIVPVEEGAIAACLERLLGDRNLRDKMGQYGYHSARQHFDIRTVAEKMAIAYEGILTGRRSPECRWVDGNGTQS